jgi:hypothetical protein
MIKPEETCKCGKPAEWSEYCQDCWEVYCDKMYWGFLKALPYNEIELKQENSSE